jgi:hypothetical protein
LIVYYFQKEWLDKFEQAKKARLVQEQQKRESANPIERSPSRPSHSESLESPTNRELSNGHKCSPLCPRTPLAREIYFVIAFKPFRSVCLSGFFLFFFLSFSFFFFFLSFFSFLFFSFLFFSFLFFSCEMGIK